MKITDPTLFYENQEEPNKSCFLALRSLILNCNSNISEAVKYGMPCFCYLNKVFCYLWSDKKTKEPYILFVDGDLLEHPDLETGSRKRMKILRTNPTNDLPVNTIYTLLHLAITIVKNKK